MPGRAQEARGSGEPSSRTVILPGGRALGCYYSTEIYESIKNESQTGLVLQRSALAVLGTSSIVPAFLCRVLSPLYCQAPVLSTNFSRAFKFGQLTPSIPLQTQHTGSNTLYLPLYVAPDPRVHSNPVPLGLVNPWVPSWILMASGFEE